MNIKGEYISEIRSGQKAMVFVFSSTNDKISKYIKLFNVYEETRLVTPRVDDKLVILRRQLEVLKKLYRYVIAVSSQNESQTALKDEKKEFRLRCAEKFFTIVDNLRTYFDCAQMAKSKPDPSIIAYFTYLNEDALMKLRAVPEGAPIVSEMPNVVDDKTWVYARNASIIAAVAGGVLVGGGSEQLYEHIAQAPDVLGDFVSGAAGASVGVVTGGAWGYKFFQPSTPVDKAAQADPEYDVELASPTLGK